MITDCFSTDLSDKQAFLLFTVLHLYAIRVPVGLLRGRPESTEFAALTQRGASEALAYLWRGTNDERGHYGFWYWRWNTEWGAYGHAEHLSSTEQDALRDILARLREHVWVTDIFEEH